MGTCTNSSSSSMSSIMTILPNDVIANEILGKGYLSDKTIQRFLLAVGERRATKVYKLDQQFCMKHGSKLEDSNQFQTTTMTRSHRENLRSNSNSNNKQYHCVVPNVVPKHNIPNDAMVVKSSSPNTASVVLIIIQEDRVYAVNNVTRWNFVMSVSRTLLILITMLLILTLILVLMLMLDNNNNNN